MISPSNFEIAKQFPTYWPSYFLYETLVIGVQLPYVAEELYHISTADLERYHRGKIRNLEELTMIEEHLLWCQDCIDREAHVERLIETPKTRFEPV